MSLLSKYKQSSAMDSLVDRVGKLTEPKNPNKEEDANLWYPSVDKAGNGYAVVRFLPPPEGEDDAIVMRFTHGFKGPTGQWYIEHSRTTFGERDPVSEMNSRLWNAGDQDTARERKRKQEFFTNVYVIRDKDHPENEGKVFVLKFGQKIFQKIQSVMKPPEGMEDEKMNPFDLYRGANFKFKIKTVGGYRNYDDSTFDGQSVFLDGDEPAMEKALSQLHSVAQYVAREKFKSYDELKARLNIVVGNDDEDEAPFDGGVKTSSTKKSSATVKAKLAEVEEPSEDDEILARLKKEIAGYTE